MKNNPKNAFSASHLNAFDNRGVRTDERRMDNSSYIKFKYCLIPTQ